MITNNKTKFKWPIYPGPMCVGRSWRNSYQRSRGMKTTYWKTLFAVNMKDYQPWLVITNTTKAIFFLHQNQPLWILHRPGLEVVFSRAAIKCKFEPPSVLVLIFINFYQEDDDEEEGEGEEEHGRSRSEGSCLLCFPWFIRGMYCCYNLI